MIIEEKAFAKINLSLEVLGKRMDGYHDILSTMASVEMHDLLKLKQIKKTNGQINISIDVSGKYKSIFDEIDLKNNLIYKAAEKYCENCSFGFDAKLYLEKNIPSGAGLGGGSADAAAMLRILNKMFELYSPEQLNRIASVVGADVPFCLMNGIAICEGIGEIILPLDVNLNYFVVIANDGIHIDTKKAYKMLDANLTKNYDIFNKKSKLIAQLNKGILDGNYQCFINDFESVVFNGHISIKDLKTFFVQNDADFSLMSGSGSSVYGLYSELEKAQIVCEKLKTKCRNVFLTGFQEK